MVMLDGCRGGGRSEIGEWEMESAELELDLKDFSDA